MDEIDKKEEGNLRKSYAGQGCSMAYLCAVCGGFAYVAIDSIDSGTTLTCGKCGGKTVIDLDTPERRAERYQEAKTSRAAVAFVAGALAAVNVPHAMDIGGGHLEGCQACKLNELTNRLYATFGQKVLPCKCCHAGYPCEHCEVHRDLIPQRKEAEKLVSTFFDSSIRHVGRMPEDVWSAVPHLLPTVKP